MSAKTNEQLTADIKTLSAQLSGISAQLTKLQQDINSRARLSDLQSIKDELTGLITDNSELIGKLEQKLAKVILPDDTEYYLESSEIESFRSNYAKLLAMMSTFEQLYKNIVAYSANLSST